MRLTGAGEEPIRYSVTSYGFFLICRPTEQSRLDRLLSPPLGRANISRAID